MTKNHGTCSTNGLRNRGDRRHANPGKTVRLSGANRAMKEARIAELIERASKRLPL